jgi:hypothetical protein
VRHVRFLARKGGDWKRKGGDWRGRVGTGKEGWGPFKHINLEKVKKI